MVLCGEECNVKLVSSKDEDLLKYVSKFIEKPLSLDQCDKLNTKRLLTYYKKYRNSTTHLFSYYEQCLCQLSEYDKDLYHKFKDYMGKIKSILDEREHIA